MSLKWCNQIKQQPINRYSNVKLLLHFLLYLKFPSGCNILNIINVVRCLCLFLNIDLKWLNFVSEQNCLINRWMLQTSSLHQLVIYLWRLNFQETYRNVMGLKLWWQTAVQIHLWTFAKETDIYINDVI